MNHHKSCEFWQRIRSQYKTQMPQSERLNIEDVHGHFKTLSNSSISDTQTHINTTDN